MIGLRVKQAREIAGLTQTALARTVGYQQGHLSKGENGLLSFPDHILAEIAAATGFPSSFFTRPDPFEVPLVALRSKASLTAARRHQARRLGEIILEQTLRMRDRVGRVPLRFESMRGEPVESVSANVRSALGFPAGDPVLDLPFRIEKAGIVAIGVPLQAGKLDAFSAWVGSEPVVWLLDTPAGDRQSWSVAHELGHLAHGTDDCAVANHFAMHLLVPRDRALLSVGERTTLEEYALLKRGWGVSVQALVRSAHSYEIISKERYQGLFRQISARGERLRERLAIEPVKPRGFRKLAEHLWGPDPVGMLARDADWSESMAADVLSRHATLDELPRRRRSREPVPSNVVHLKPRAM